MGIILIEPAIVPAIFCSGIAEPEDLGDGNVLFTAFAKQRSFSGDGRRVEHVVVNRAVMSFPTVIQSLKLTVQTLRVQCFCHDHVRLVR